MKQELQNAAVLVPCFEEKGETWVILTRRTDQVDHHKGQICFPGGMLDPQDSDLWSTALREAQEEIGLVVNQVTLIKELSERITPSGFRVKPFVASVQPPAHWQISQSEIAEVFNVPLSFLRNPTNLSWVPRQLGELRYVDPLFVYEGREIWGLTARILCEFLGHEFPANADSVIQVPVGRP